MRPIEIVIILNLHNKIGLMSGIWHCKENSSGLSNAVIYNGDGFGKWGGGVGGHCVSSTKDEEALILMEINV